MTQSATTDFQLKLNQPSMSPIYMVTFEGISTQFSTGTVTSPSLTTKKYLYTPVGGNGEIIINEGKSSIGTYSFSLIDRNNEITKLQAAYVMQNRKVTIKMGFLGMAEAKYMTLFVGRVFTFMLGNDNLDWQFQLRSLLVEEKKEIFTAQTKLTVAMGASGSVITVVNTGQAALVDYPNGLTFAPTTATKYYLKIADEVISYTGSTPTTFTGCARGQLGTVANVHDIDSEVVQLVVLNGNPIDLALQILHSTGMGTNNPTYDIHPASVGLGVQEDLIDLQAILLQKQDWLPTTVFQFEEFEKVMGKVFLEEQIYNMINAYPFTNGLGQISFRIYTPPMPKSGIHTLNDDNMVGSPTWTGNILNRFFLNEVDLSFDWNFRTQLFESRLFYEDATSQIKYGTPTAPYVVTKQLMSRGMRTSVTTLTKIDRIPSRMLKRFSNASPILKVRAFLKEKQIEVGDPINMTSSKIPNAITGAMGVFDRIYEVIKQDVEFYTGVLYYEILDTGQVYQKKYAAISPPTTAGFPDYLLATAAQRNYAFISELVPGNNDIGHMSNGDDGYYITP